MADRAYHSLPGGSAETHNAIRVNSDFRNLLANIGLINELKAVRKLDRPGLHIVYLMLRGREKISKHSSRSDLWLDLVGLIEQNRRNNRLFRGFCD